MIQRERRWGLLVCSIFVLSAALRATYSLLPFPAGDGGMYLRLADKILSGNFFFSADPDTFDQLYRTPSYPVFLALLSHLPWSTTGAAVAAQRLLGLCSAVLVYKIGMLVWARRPVAAAGAMFAGLHFHFIYFEAYLLSETLAVFLACAALYLALLLHRCRSAGWCLYALGGLLAACAGLCRPELFALGGLVLILFLTGGRAPGTASSGRLAAYLLPLLLLPGAWTLRNGLLYDYWGLTPNSAITFFSGPAGRLIRAAEVPPDVVSAEALKYRYADGLANRAVTALTKNGIFYQWSARQIGGMARESALARPAEYFRASCRQLYELLFGNSAWPPRDITETIPDLFSGGGGFPRGLLGFLGAADGFLESWFLGPLFLLGCGAAFFCRRSGAELVLAALPACLLVTYAFLSPVSVRYRVVAEPFMALLAANAAYSLFLRLVKRKPPAVPGNAVLPAWLSDKWILPLLITVFCCWAWFLSGTAAAWKDRGLSALPEAAADLRATADGSGGKETFNRLGYLALARGLSPAALRWFDLALAVEPADKTASDGRAEALFRMGRGREALAELYRNLAAHPAAADVLYNIAWVNYLAGDRESAVKEFTEFLRLSGAAPEARKHAARLLQEQLQR